MLRPTNWSISMYRPLENRLEFPKDQEKEKENSKSIQKARPIRTTYTHLHMALKEPVRLPYP